MNETAKVIRFYKTGRSDVLRTDEAIKRERSVDPGTSY
jgi:hypothetical protein